jgi:hypothetical protein
MGRTGQQPLESFKAARRSRLNRGKSAVAFRGSCVHTDARDVPAGTGMREEYVASPLLQLGHRPHFTNNVARSSEGDQFQICSLT